MSNVVNQREPVGLAVEWWLGREAANSSYNGNKVLDDLVAGRQALLDGIDPKGTSHLNRMHNWLAEYRKDTLSPDEQSDFTAMIAFGSLMILSGCYRKQRYFQAEDQTDYLNRKFDWIHPGGAPVAGYFDRVSGGTHLAGAESIAHEAEAIMAKTEDTLDFLYGRARSDMGRERSPAIIAIRIEQKRWLGFLAGMLNDASQRTGVALLDVPILSPKTFTEAQPTTLRAMIPA